jgi:hypothetical protein
LRSGFKYGFESLSDRFYFRLKYLYRQLKKIFIFLIGFVFRTLSFFEILPMILRAFVMVLTFIVFYDLSLNLPLYLLKLNTSSFTVNFCSGYISFYEGFLLVCNESFFCFLINKYNFYLVALILLQIFKSFDLVLRLKYDWLVSKNLTICGSFEEFKFIENSSVNIHNPINYSFKISVSS